MIVLNELNKLNVADYSVMGEELEYVLVEDVPENRKIIDLALATQFNWAIVDMGNPWHLTAGGGEIISKCSGEGYINLCEILIDELGLNVEWSKSKGFRLACDNAGE